MSEEGFHNLTIAACDVFDELSEAVNPVAPMHFIQVSLVTELYIKTKANEI